MFTDYTITEDIKNKDEFISILSSRARFSKKDIKIILDEMVKMFEEATRVEKQINIGRFGRLYHQILPARKSGIDGSMLPPARRTAFRLSDNIRSGGKVEIISSEEETENAKSGVESGNLAEYFKKGGID